MDSTPTRPRSRANSTQGSNSRASSAAGSASGSQVDPASLAQEQRILMDLLDPSNPEEQELANTEANIEALAISEPPPVTLSSVQFNALLAKINSLEKEVKQARKTQTVDPAVAALREEVKANNRKVEEAKLAARSSLAKLNTRVNSGPGQQPKRLLSQDQNGAVSPALSTSSVLELDDLPMLPSQTHDGLLDSLKPLYSACHVSLNPDKYDERTKKNIRRSVRNHYDAAIFDVNFTKQHRRAQVPVTRYVDSPPQLTPDLLRFPNAPSATTKSFHDRMKKHDKQFTDKSPLLHDFLKDFVTFVREFQISMQQARAFFPGFFGGKLRAEVEDIIRTEGLQPAIDIMFRHKCDRNHLIAANRELENFHFSNSANFLSEVLNYRMLYKQVNGPVSASIIDSVIKEVAKLQLDSASKLVLSNEVEDYRRRFGPIPFEEWIFIFTCQDLKFVRSGRTVAHVQESYYDHFNYEVDSSPREDFPPLQSSNNHHSADFQSQEASLLDTYMKGRAAGLQDAKDIFLLQNQGSPSPSHSTNNVSSSSRPSSGSAKPHSGGASGKPPSSRATAPVDRKDPLFVLAAKKYSVANLINKKEGAYAHEGQKNLPYSVSGQNFVPNKKLTPIPTRLSQFVKLENGNPVVSFDFRNHFAHRCTSCGMDGHSAIHPDCPMKNSDSSWDVCTRCKCALHIPVQCRVAMSGIESSSFLR